MKKTAAPTYQINLGHILYLAGPMRGRPDQNAKAFDDAEAALRSKGFSNVVNPATISKQCGMDLSKEPTDDEVRLAMATDVGIIVREVDAMVMLPGWENSVGATAEYHLARWKKIPVLLYPSLIPVEAESILSAAHTLVRGARQQEYGDPVVNLNTIARFWSIYLRVKVTAAQVAYMMILLKVARGIQDQTNRDTLTDIAGYAELVFFIEQYAARSTPRPVAPPTDLDAVRSRQGSMGAALDGKMIGLGDEGVVESSEDLEDTEETVMPKLDELLVEETETCPRCLGKCRLRDAVFRTWHPCPRCLGAGKIYRVIPS